MIKKILTISLFAAVFSLAQADLASANEIHYGHIEDVHGEDLLIQYKGPTGEAYLVCGVSDRECEAFGTSSPLFFPAIDEERDYVNSPDGLYGIVKSTTQQDSGSTTYAHTLYDVSGDSAQEVGVVPYNKDVSHYKFPWASDHIVLFGTDGTVATYDIRTEDITTIDPDQTEFPFRSLSPHAQYLSAYNYTEEAHKVWNTTTGDLVTVPSQTPAFVEFSQNEQFAAFIDDRDDYQTLYITDLDKQSGDGENVKRVFEGDFTVEDYLFFKGDLYAVGNTADDPYRWVLYRYDPVSEETDIVAENVSYGDYIRPIGDEALSFLVIDGKNSNVALYDPESDDVGVVAPVEPSPASEEISRSVVEFDDGVHGVLYEPDNPDEHSDLFVWLHGGPRRQTSIGYHSYLSYAVYDELLERLAESGAYVLKLDYAGSYGYGSEFIDKLTNGIGSADVANVSDAAREIQDEYDIDDTYLIGNSYGGYLAAKVLVDESYHFNGAVAINGVFDWLTLLERIPSSPFKTYFEGLPDLDDLDHNFELYEQASITKDLPDLSNTRKLLLVYGEDDSTVPVWQTREFYYQAKTLGKNIEVLELEDEGHIIRDRDNLDRVCEFIADELWLNDLDC